MKSRFSAKSVSMIDVVIFTAPLVVVMAVLLAFVARNEVLIGLRPSWRGSLMLSGQFHDRMLDGKRALLAQRLSNAAGESSQDADTLHIYIPENNWKELSSDLPASGFEWKEARVLRGDQIIDVDLRLRGDYGIHFFHRRKSLKLRFPRETMIDGRRRLNLSAKRFFQQRFLYELAAGFDLMTPKSGFVRVFMNRHYYATMLEVEETDETFLRRRGFMPGNVYNGENIENTVHRELGSFLWDNPHIWEKKANYNRHDPEDMTELAGLLSVLDLPDRIEKWRALDRKFARDEFVRYGAFVMFSNQVHQDAVHNLRYFVDPLTGVLHPIVWDPLMLLLYPNLETLRDIADVKLFHKQDKILYAFMENPAFYRDILAYLADRIADGSVDRALGVAREDMRDVELYLAIDRLDSNEAIIHTGIGKQRVREIETMSKANTEALAAGIRNVSVAWNTTRARSGNLQLNVRVDGSGAVELTGLGLAQSEAGAAEPPRAAIDAGRRFLARAKLTLEVSPAGPDAYARRFEAQRATADEEPEPGAGGPSSASSVNWRPSGEIRLGGRLRLEGKSLVSAPTSYRITIPGTRSAGLEVASLRFENLFGEPLADSLVTRGDFAPVEVFDDGDFIPRPTPRDVVLGPGVVRLTENLVIDRHESLIVRPGTTLMLSKGVSIACYGNARLVGNAARRIEIRPAVEEEAWGTFMVQGWGGPGGFRMEHCKVWGGSDATIDGVYFSGMVDVRYIPDGLVKNSEFYGNRFGDDAFHASSSSMRVVDCVFHDTASDAIDFDFTDAIIEGSTFERSGNDSVDIMGSQVEVRNCRFIDSGDKGISAGEASELFVSDSEFVRCGRGIELKDGTEGYVYGSSITASVEYGINAYSKNWRYSDGGHGEFWNCTFDNERNFNADALSSLQVYQSEVGGGWRIGDSVVIDGHRTLLGSAPAMPAEPRKERERADSHRVAQLVSASARVHAEWKFDDDFDSLNNGWTGRSEIEVITKRRHALSIKSDARQLWVRHDLPAVELEENATLVLELTAASSGGGELEVAFGSAGDPSAADSVSFILDQEGNYKTFRVEIPSGASEVTLSMPAEREELTVRKVRLVEMETLR